MNAAPSKAGNALQALRVAFRGFPHFLPGFAAIVFGGILLLPGETFSNSHNFDVMRRYANELQWGGAFAACGLVSLLTRSLVRHAAWITVVPIMAGFSYVSIATGIASSAQMAANGSGIATASGLCGVIAIASFWAIVDKS